MHIELAEVLVAPTCLAVKAKSEMRHNLGIGLSPLPERNEQRQKVAYLPSLTPHLTTKVVCGRQAGLERTIQQRTFPQPTRSAHSQYVGCRVCVYGLGMARLPT